MMDDERNRKEYNNLREVCLGRCRTSLDIRHDWCKVVTDRDCKPDKYNECPLFVFTKKMRGKYGNR